MLLWCNKVNWCCSNPAQPRVKSTKLSGHCCLTNWFLVCHNATFLSLSLLNFFHSIFPHDVVGNWLFVCFLLVIILFNFDTQLICMVCQFLALLYIFTFFPNILLKNCVLKIQFSCYKKFNRDMFWSYIFKFNKRNFFVKLFVGQRPYKSWIRDSKTHHYLSVYSTQILSFEFALYWKWLLVE
jgi:hypothetical protein